MTLPEALRDGYRAFRARPVWLAFVVATLGLAFGFIGVVAAVAHAAWFHLPPGVAAQNYASLGRESAISGRIDRLAWADVEAIRERVPEVEWLTVERLMGFKFDDAAGAQHSVHAEGVSGNFFTALGMAPAQGSLTPHSDSPAIVLGHALAERLRTASGEPVEALTVEDSGLVPVIGVVPAGFSGIVGEPARLWVLNHRALPANVGNEFQELIDQTVPSQFPFGVLPTAGGPATAKALHALLADFRFAQEFQSGNRVGTSLNVTDDDRLQVTAGLEARPAVREQALARTRWLVAIVCCLFLLALLGLVDFLLTEQHVADEELGVRIAAGATPAALFRDCAIGNGAWLLAVALVGGASSHYLAAALLAVEPFASWLGALPARAIGVGVALGGASLVLAFAAAIGLAVRSSLRKSRKSTASGWRRTARRALLGVATACLLLVASVLGRYAQETNLGLGMANPNVLMVLVWAEDGSLQADVVRDLIAGLPAVRAFGRMDLIPLIEPYSRRNTAELVGEENLADADFLHSGVAPGFFDALGVEVLAGRLADSADEAVISRAAAMQLGNGDIRQALGRTIRVRRDYGEENDVLAVTGVVADMPYGNYLDPPRNVIYQYAPGAPWDHRWVIDHVGPAEDVLAALREAPALEGFEVLEIPTPAALFRTQFMAVRSVEIVLAGAAALALVLAFAGIFNSLAAAMAEEKRALGIRLALGATPWALAEGNLGEGLRDLVIGVALPFAGMLALTLALPRFDAATDLLAWWLLLPVAAVVAAIAAAAILGLLRRYATSAALVSLLHAGPGVGRR